MKTINLLLVLLIISFTSCKEDDDVKPENKLEQTGILGKWEISVYTINGITDMSVHCCDFLEFDKDGQDDDLRGQFKAYGTGYETMGDFELNTDNNTVSFYFNDNQRVYGYQIQGSDLIFDYKEDGLDIIETWVKIE